MNQAAKKYCAQEREPDSTCWAVEACPKCKTSNWFYGNDPTLEDALKCWKCDHRWIYFGDETIFEMFCEDNGIREGLDDDELLEGDEPEVYYETLQAYLDDQKGNYGRGERYENLTSVEDRKRLYEELKKEFD